MSALQILLAEEVSSAGGPECAIELPVEGAYGCDRWDVLSILTDLPMLGISTKSLTSSRDHNVANRARELPGEALALRERHPDVVLGFLCVIDARASGRLRGDGRSPQTIADAISARCQGLAVGPQHFDLGCVLYADLATGRFDPLGAANLRGFEGFIEGLCRLWHQRLRVRS